MGEVLVGRLQKDCSMRLEFEADARGARSVRVIVRVDS
jgi:hypothetical protein